MEFFLQIVLILACLFYGARKGGLALGLLGGKPLSIGVSSSCMAGCLLAAARGLV